MTNALDDVDAAFTKQTGVKVVTSYDASSGIGRWEHKEAQRAQGSAESALPREKHKKKSGPMTRGRFAIVPKATKVEFG